MTELKTSAARFSALAALFAVLNVAFVGTSQNTDMFLRYAPLLLQGLKLGRDWITVNSPLTLWIYTPPAALIQLSHLPSAPVLHCYIVLLCAASLLLLNHALASQGLGAAARRHWQAAAAVTLFVISSQCSAFGDREHLLFIFTLPWIIQLLLGFAPLPSTALFAALGFFLKPYNLIFFLALQGFDKGLFTAPARIIIAAGLAYAAILGLFFPDYLEGAVPLAFIAYPYLSRPMHEKMELAAALLSVAGMLAYECIGASRERRAWYALFAAAFVTYCLNAGWGYTLYLLFAPMTLLAFRLLERAEAQERHRLSAQATRAVAYTLLAALLAQGAWFLGQDIRATAKDGYARDYIHLPAPFYARLRDAAGGEFILLSTTLWSNNISGAGHGEPVFAYEVLWPLPWLYAHPGDARSGHVERAIAEPLLAALALHPKAALIVDASPLQWRLPNDADVLGFLKQDPGLSRALASYHEAETIDDCGDVARETDLLQAACRFRVWRRGPD